MLMDGRRYKESIIPICNKNKYSRFAYTHKGKRYFLSVHRAVFFSFNDVEIPKDKYRFVIDHIDEDKHNNRLSNLQLISQSHNVLKSLSSARC